MRWLAWSMMAVCGLVVGCNEPVETIRSVDPTSGTTGEHDDGDIHVHDDGEVHMHDDGEVDVHDDGSLDGTPAVEEVPVDDSAATEPEAVRFVADKRLKVPGMMCPYACYPAVKEALVGVPGVEAVQLAEQPEGTPEGKIENKVVELKLADGFDVSAAVAALKEANYEADVVN